LHSLCDVNVLVPLLYGAHPHSKRAQQWVSGVDEAGVLGICSMSHLASMRLLNSPAAMGADVCSGKEAWAAVDGLMKDNRFSFAEEPEGLRGHLRTLTGKVKHSPKVWQDAYLAAFAMASGRKLVTFDRGFTAYPGLEVQIL
jgi:toxin-antitoxin system PIN domain toxin